MHIGIIGAGHAGIEAAVAARQAGAEVTVFSAEDVLPYFRPRLVAVAMGQVAPNEIGMHPSAWYEERGIRLRLSTPVTMLDVATRTIVTGEVSERFNAIVLACGASPHRFDVRGKTCDMPIFALWSMADAEKFRQKVRPGARLVVIGGSSLGIECALRANEQRMKVTVLEQMSRLMPRHLGAGAAAFVQQQLEGRGIAIQTDRVLASFGEAADGESLVVRLNDGSALEADLVLVSIGSAPELFLARQSGLATGRGICTDACLQASPGIFVAGDVCQAAGQPARGVVREAMAQGRLAGTNATAFGSGSALQTFVPLAISTTVHCCGFEINFAGQAGAALTEDRLDDGAAGNVFRSVTRHADGTLAGVQMIGTREGIDELVAKIK